MLPLDSNRDKVELEVTSKRLKLGAFDPSDIMFDGVLAIIYILSNLILNYKSLLLKKNPR